MFEEGLAELHTHLGGSVASEILWSIAHEQGIALPVKDYWEFDRLVTIADPRGIINATGMEYDNKSKTVKLKSRVSGQIEPQKK